MKPYPLWKTLLLIIVGIAGIIYAIPNFYGEQPAVQIATVSGDPLPGDFSGQVASALKAAGVTNGISHLEHKQWIVRVDDEAAQLKAASALKRALNPPGQPPIYTVALNLAAKTPAWLLAIGARPMSLGLDLRGGVHFLLQVDTQDAVHNSMSRYLGDLSRLLQDKDIHYNGRHLGNDNLTLTFPDAATLTQAKGAIAKAYNQLQLTTVDGAARPTLQVNLSQTQLKTVIDNAVDQNLITLRNRVNELGVAEPLVQRQGSNRIVVELPGVQDTTRVKELLGATATLEYHAVDETHDAAQAAATGIVPLGDQLFYTRNGHQPILLKREVIAAGSELVSAAPGFDQNGSPDVNVTLDSAGGKRMLHFTQRNVGKPMAVLYKESQIETSYAPDGKPIRTRKQIEDVISVATVQGVFGSRFQTTGLSNKQAHDLSLLLKAGALAAPVEVVEERTVGPSLGAENIHSGMMAVVVGFLLVIGFMFLYYFVFGLFADFALCLNLILIVAGLSIIGATLTMPGIAGIVLTIGMAVDANVLINERTREELRNGYPPFTAMKLGYDRAFITVADSNVTTLIAALVLFVLGTGSIKGFAVTLALGLCTSMFTALIGTRVLCYYTFRGRKLKDLPV
ncbi:MAG TPA: protein translocase subunit SecD [Nevskiaceae bacterium]|nr:protein translocase subunit SecD [Nevskiaceae bacterium]